MVTKAKTRWNFQYKNSLDDIFAPDENHDSTVNSFSINQNTKNKIVEILTNKASNDDIQKFISSLEENTRLFLNYYNEERKIAKLKAENSREKIEPSYPEIKATMEDLSGDIDKLTTKLSLIENHPVGIALKAIQELSDKQPTNITIYETIDLLNELSWLTKKAISDLEKYIKPGRHSIKIHEDYFRCIAVIWLMKLGFLPTTTEDSTYFKIMALCYESLKLGFPTNHKKFMSAGVKNAKAIKACSITCR